MELADAYADGLSTAGVGVGAYLVLAGVATALGLLGQADSGVGIVRVLAALGTAGVGGALAWLVTR